MGQGDDHETKRDPVPPAPSTMTVLDDEMEEVSVPPVPSSAQLRGLSSEVPTEVDRQTLVSADTTSAPPEVVISEARAMLDKTARPRKPLSTGSAQLDRALGGGWRAGGIYLLSARRAARAPFVAGLLGPWLDAPREVIWFGTRRAAAEQLLFRLARAKWDEEVDRPLVDPAEWLRLESGGLEPPEDIELGRVRARAANLSHFWIARPVSMPTIRAAMEAVDSVSSSRRGHALLVIESLTLLASMFVQSHGRRFAKAAALAALLEARARFGERLSVLVLDGDTKLDAANDDWMVALLSAAMRLDVGDAPESLAHARDIAHALRPSYASWLRACAGGAMDEDADSPSPFAHLVVTDLARGVESHAGFALDRTLGRIIEADGAPELAATFASAGALPERRSSRAPRRPRR